MNNRLGCWLKPLLLGLAILAYGIYRLTMWNDLPTSARALAIVITLFGAFLLLPALIMLLLNLWIWKMRQRLAESLGEVGDVFGKISANSKELYDTPPEYRDATPNDFANLDPAFYDQSEQTLQQLGFRKLGDRVNASVEKLGKPSPPIRSMTRGDTVSGTYHLVAGTKSLKVTDIETEFSDGSCLVTANTEGLDLSTSPPQIELQRLAAGTPIPDLLAHHDAALARLLAAKPGLTCTQFNTIENCIEFQKRTHAIKNEFRRANNYFDEGEVRRVAQSRGQDAPAMDPSVDRMLNEKIAAAREALRNPSGARQPSQSRQQRRESFLATIAKASEEAKERKVKKEAARGPNFLTGSGEPLPAIRFDAPPDPGVNIEGRPYVGLGGMVKVINEAKAEQNQKILDQLPLGASRFGGLPDLPPDFPWPTYKDKKLPFLAQIDLASLPRGNESLLPADGWLFAFGLFDNDPNHKPDPIVVHLLRGPASALSRAPRPAAEEIWPDWQNIATYEVLPLTARWQEGEREERQRTKLKSKLVSTERPQDAGHLFGKPVYYDVRGTAGNIADQFDRSGDDWINLLTLDSVGNMQWSDSGYLNIIIRRSDLARSDFSNVAAAIWSS